MSLSDRELSDLARRKRGVSDARVISASDVVVAEWVRLKCQFGCDGYGQCLVCPPYSPKPDQMRRVLAGYRRGLLLHFEPPATVMKVVVELEREVFLRGGWKALGFGAGPCGLCRTCPVPDGPCAFPGRARPSMEACGIDVFSTAKNAGFPLEVVRTRRQRPDYYGLILLE